MSTTPGSHSVLGVRPWFALTAAIASVGAPLASCTLESAGTLTDLPDASLHEAAAGAGPSAGAGGESGAGGLAGEAGSPVQGGAAGTGGSGGEGGWAGEGGFAGQGGSAGEGGIDAGQGGTDAAPPEDAQPDQAPDSPEGCVASAETCNGLDEDCDGVADNGDPGGGGACPTGQPGVCGAGIWHCEQATLVCQPTLAPSEELCDLLDNNCNGTIDEGNPGGGQACTTLEPGACAAGNLKCVAGQLVCHTTTQPTPELCDDVDNDCNGAVDTGCPEAVVVQASFVLTPLRGSATGGGAFQDTCPAGQVLVGITGRAGGNVDQLAARCAAVELGVDVATLPFTFPIRVVPPVTTLTMHGTQATTVYELNCPANTAVTGIFGRADQTAVRKLGIICSSMEAAGAPGAYGVQFSTQSKSTLVGTNTQGTDFEDVCVGGSVVATLAGRSGALIDAVRVGCHATSVTLAN